MKFVSQRVSSAEIERRIVATRTEQIRCRELKLYIGDNTCQERIDQYLDELIIRGYARV
jgi:hypothetical protein